MTNCGFQWLEKYFHYWIFDWIKTLSKAMLQLITKRKVFSYQILAEFHLTKLHWEVDLEIIDDGDNDRPETSRS